MSMELMYLEDESDEFLPDDSWKSLANAVIASPGFNPVILNCGNCGSLHIIMMEWKSEKVQLPGGRIATLYEFVTNCADCGSDEYTVMMCSPSKPSRMNAIRGLVHDLPKAR